MNCYVEIYGCQMNAYDGDLVKTVMRRAGSAIVETPAEADVIFVVTCSVREHAEQRVLGRLGELYSLKKERPGLVMGVLGCMAQRLGDELFRMAPYVDMVMGPDSYRQLPETVSAVRRGTRHAAVLDDGAHETYGEIELPESGKVAVSVAAMRGCSEFCTYCIVPKVRGPERSRPPAEIRAETERAVAAGAVQVTLLGQNITAYRSGETDLADLLRIVADIPGLRRLRFLTSHPRYLGEEVGDAMAANGTICRHMHLPLQSGSNRVLRMMGRRYTVEEYLAKVHSLRAKIPGIALTTDLIAGFPGETRTDFEETLEVMREVVFDDAYTYKYSARPGTPAVRIARDADPGEAQERLEELIVLQRAHTAGRNRSFTGASLEVLVEGVSRKGTGEFFGKSSCGRSVVFAGEGLKAGDLVQVRIRGTTGPTLLGCAA